MLQRPPSLPPQAKLGNINNNGFRTRRLFKMYDKGNTGLIHFEDFRMMGESFGMQLDDDSLLALYYVMDPNATGCAAAACCPVPLRVCALLCPGGDAGSATLGVGGARSLLAC